ncbi:MAG: MFS transporter [Muribaculaceae bacterium]|nr:MFS transporter [Muribaculaceae bacterium]MDE6792084.1 MFS transporter [Muribaculaceae bacterium]
MKYVNSGEGKIPLITLISILTISLAVNLPGLAISPILGKLDQVFHHVTELEVQLLTVLPNLVTIPFILCSGKICSEKNQIFVLGLGLVIYTVTGILYFFAGSMTELIILSCVLGMGCGLIIPLAASLISQNFTGKARTKQLGMKSSLSNFSIIFATLFVGWAASIDWHLSFLVYLVPIIPLVLIYFMSNRYIQKHRILDSVAPASSTGQTASVSSGASGTGGTPASNSVAQRFTKKQALWLLIGIMVLYFVITYATDMVSYYLPFTMEHYHFSTDDVGVATSLYFAGITLGGFLLTHVIAILRQYTMQVAIALCIIGLFMVGFLHAYWSFILGVFLMGFGYGVIQPVFYDKTSDIAPTPAKSTAYFSYLLACNYVGIAVVPFIIGGAEKLFKAQNDPNFSAIFNGCVLVVLLIIAIFKCRSFVFKAEEK